MIGTRPVAERDGEAGSMARSTGAVPFPQNAAGPLSGKTASQNRFGSRAAAHRSVFGDKNARVFREYGFVIVPPA